MLKEDRELPFDSKLMRPVENKVPRSVPARRGQGVSAMSSMALAVQEKMVMVLSVVLLSFGFYKNTKSVGKLSFRMACVEVHKPIKVLVMNRKNQMILKIFINDTVDYHRLLLLKFSEHSKIQSALQDTS